jgi:hypothetical protein
MPSEVRGLDIFIVDSAELSGFSGVSLDGRGCHSPLLRIGGGWIPEQVSEDWQYSPRDLVVVW